MTAPFALHECSEGWRARDVAAEDEPVVRLETIDFLTDEGFEVHEAYDAAAALVHLERLDGIDLLFTDARIPGLRDGLALAREVAERWPSARIVVCSAFSRPADGALPAGAHFFDKPLPVPLVRRVLR